MSKAAEAKSLLLLKTNGWDCVTRQKGGHACQALSSAKGLIIRSATVEAAES